MTSILGFEMMGVICDGAQVEACREVSLVFCPVSVVTKLVRGYQDISLYLDVELIHVRVSVA